MHVAKRLLLLCSALVIKTIECHYEITPVVTSLPWSNKKDVILYSNSPVLSYGSLFPGFIIAVKYPIS